MNSFRSFKDKEEKLEENFSKLLDRYSKSKQLIESIYNKVEQNKVMVPHTVKVLRTSRSRRNFEKENKTAQHISNHSIENINKLRETINMKENIEHQKIERLKILAKELKTQVLELQDRNTHLEQKLKQKESALRTRDDELASVKDTTLKNQLGFHESKLREESYSQQMQILKDNVANLKIKLDKKKKSSKAIKSKLQQIESQNEQQSLKFNQEFERLQKMCDQLVQEVKELETSKQLLNNELTKNTDQMKYKEERNVQLEKSCQDLKLKEQEYSIRLEQEIEKRREYQQKFEGLNRNTEDLKETLTQTESRYQKLKVRIEEERQSIAKEYEQQIISKREKIKKLKEKNTNLMTEIQEKNNKINEVQRLVTFRDMEIEKINNHLTEEKLIGEQRVSDLKLQQDEIKQLKQQIKQQDNVIVQLQIKIKDQDKDKLDDERIRRDIYKQLEDSEETKRKLLQTIQEFEMELSRVKETHLKEIDQIDLNIEQILKETSQLKSENIQMKNVEQSQKRQINFLNEQVEATRQKNEKLKERSRQLSQKLRFCEDKLKVMETERSLIQNQQLKLLTTNQGDVKSGKIKVLDEIKGAIQHFKGR